MMFKFDPISDSELQGLLQDGIYNFKVIKATQRDSKSGNPMIALELSVWDNKGNIHRINDYLVNIKSMMYKIKHFCDSIGMTEEYEKGMFSDKSCEGKSGKAKIFIEKGKERPDGGMYWDKNAVKDYVPIKLTEIKSETHKEFNDDIPF